jgi:hypothetical protein
VLNVFENPTTRGTYDGKSLIESSDRLRFTAIRLVEGAANRLEIFHLTPLQEAWVIAHRDLISRQEPDASWRIRPVAYWQLFERNQGAEWADELAWVAAQLVPVTDECGADCHLFIIQEGPQQYWTRIPSGRYLRDALARANLMAVDAITAASYEAPTRVPIDKLRASLANVDPQSKAELLQTLARLERLVK